MITPRPIQHYDDGELTGLAVVEQISEEWASGRYSNIAAVTSVIHKKNSHLPRSAIFWLAYHTIHPAAGTAAP